jgi:uncharacterized protein
MGNEHAAAAPAQSRPPAYDVQVIRNIRIPTHTDGVTLAADLYLPHTEHPVPALVTQHYGRRVMGLRCFKYFAARGYASLVVDCRGVGESDGLPRPPLDPAEAEDGVAMVEWAAGQPWSTGRVGMWGLSYGAALALLTASRRPSPLKAIVPIMGFTSAERDLVHPGGLRGGMGFVSFSCLEEMLNDLLPPLRGHDLDERRQRWKAKLDRFEPWIVDAWRLAPGDPQWCSRDVDVTRITAATFCVAGWRDLFCDAMLRAYELIRAPKKLIVGPWLHELPERSPVEPVDSMALVCAWWDRWLSATADDTRHEEPATIYVQGAGSRWVQSTTWPVDGKEQITLVATSDRFLARSVDDVAQGDAAAPAPGVVPVGWATDPTVGALSGLWTLPISDIGYPLDQHDDDSRSLAFTSRPLPEPVMLLGRPTVVLALDRATVADRCVLKLTDVDEDGRSTVVTVGLVKLPRPQSHPGTDRYEVSVALNPTCYEIARGHRVRLVLSDADFPRLWPSRASADFRVLTMQPRGGGDPIGPMVPAGVTSIVLPVGRPDDLYRAVPPAPVPVADRKSGPDRFTRRPVWRISRDHCRRAVSLEIAATESRLYTPDQEEILKRDFSATAVVVRGEPPAASVTASANFVIDTQDGDRLTIRAAVDIGDTGGEATGEIMVNGVTSYARKWSSDDRAWP